jgi:hypothetical protein
MESVVDASFNATTLRLAGYTYSNMQTACVYLKNTVKLSVSQIINLGSNVLLGHA